MKHKNYHDICDFSQKFYKQNPAFFPQNNILDGSRSRIRECNVINDEFNALFYYEYIMYLVGIDSKCLVLKKN